MSHTEFSRHDAAFLPLFDRGVWLTVAQVRERCDDPWAPSATEEWLRDATARRLLVARRSSAVDLPGEWAIT
ncbi:MAG: hypothetical protein H0V50_06565, partial [Thermoleophilaceae bacterium]|nr:hypothetical protein [Thermoleophilaceae bacterium]